MHYKWVNTYTSLCICIDKEDGSSDDHDFLDMDDLGMDTEKARRLLGNLMHMQYTSQMNETYILI